MYRLRLIRKVLPQIRVESRFILLSAGLALSRLFQFEEIPAELFEKGFWNYMVAGRAKYISKQDEIISLENAQKLPGKWKVKMDPANEGRTNKWFDVAFDDGLWKEASILECLEKHLKYVAPKKIAIEKAHKGFVYWAKVS